MQISIKKVQKVTKKEFSSDKICTITYNNFARNLIYIKKY